MKKSFFYLTIFTFSIFLTSCGATYNQVATFPPAEEVFMTSGDGDIKKPYTPVAQLIYLKKGWRIALPLFGMFSIADVNPEKELREAVINEIKNKGGDGLINMKITFEAPSSGILGINAKGGTIFVTGTIIKR